MAVTAKFVPDRIEVLPNVATTWALRLYNGDAGSRAVTVSTSGELSEHVRLDSTTATLETNQIVDVVVTIEAPSNVGAGSYTIAAAVASPAAAGVGGDGHGDQADGNDNGDGKESSGDRSEPMVVATAVGNVDVAAHSSHALSLRPTRSRGSKRGRHTIGVTNTGNVVVTLDLAVAPRDDDLDVDLGPGSITVAPGSTSELPIRVTAPTTYWSGPTIDHDFGLVVTSSDGQVDEVSGVYRQRPHVPNWVGPAAAGALAAIIIGAIAWFAVLRPWVEDTADQAAADAIERDRVALQERIEELELAAAEAEELPLGQPTDIRLEVAPTGGNTEQDAAGVDAGTVLSVTDVVFQNPTGAVGTVTLRRGDDTLLQSELANFRDFDLHFVAPYQFGDDVEVVLEVECRTPGAGLDTCPIGASLIGFVDEVD
jgi:hypothetical protein